MANEDKKTPNEASTIFRNIIKASVSPKATGAKTDKVKSDPLVNGLKEDLLKSARGGKDEIYIENDYIVVKIPVNENFHSAKHQLIPIVNTSMISRYANRAAVKITDGKEVEILSWGF